MRVLTHMLTNWIKENCITSLISTYLFLPPPPKPNCNTSHVFANLMCIFCLNIFKSLCLHAQNMRQLFNWIPLSNQTWNVGVDFSFEREIYLNKVSYMPYYSNEDCLKLFASQVSLIFNEGSKLQLHPGNVGNESCEDGTSLR